MQDKKSHPKKKQLFKWSCSDSFQSQAIQSEVCVFFIEEKNYHGLK